MVKNHVSSHYKNIADKIFGDSGNLASGYSGASNALKEYSQGNLIANIAAQKGITIESMNKKVAAVTNLIAKLMQDPKVQDAVANVDASAVGMGATLIKKLEPIILNTSLKAGGELSTAGIQSIEGIIDVIPVVDDVEGLGQLFYSVTKFAAAGMTTASSFADTLTVIMETVSGKGLELAKRINNAITSASNAIPTPNVVKRINTAVTSASNNTQPSNVVKRINTAPSNNTYTSKLQSGSGKHKKSRHKKSRHKKSRHKKSRHKKSRHKK